MTVLVERRDKPSRKSTLQHAFVVSELIHDVNVQRTGGNYDFRGVNWLLMGNYQLPLPVLGLSLTAPSCPPSRLSADAPSSVIIQLRCLQTPTDPT